VIESTRHPDRDSKRKRRRRVVELRNAVREGTYRVDVALLAAALIQAGIA
jgi:anti-sigma28 factor (negative regulator of flagellin synthesis)